MSAITTAIVVSLYFLVLLIIGYITSRKNDNKTFFAANNNSLWYVVAFGMIGTSISGVTFISVPGKVGTTYEVAGETIYSGFSYLQFVFGNFIGYLVVAFVLLPLYYKLNLTSIYTYLAERYGKLTYRTGAFFFLLSRTLGSALRLYLAVSVFQIFIFDEWGLPFELSVIISLGLIVLYSIRGGIKTIIWTDTLQTVFLLSALIFTIIYINKSLGLGFGDSLKTLSENKLSKIFFWNYNDKNFFWKQFISGIFISIAMVGLDQDMMQKNLTCKNIKEAQKNMLTFSFIFVFINILFLSLGALLYIFAQKNGITVEGAADNFYPTLALKHLPVYVSFVFIIGLTAAAFASTDSALTALTTSFCVDFLGFDKKEDSDSKKNIRTRYAVHISFAVINILIIIIAKYWNDRSIIDTIFKLAGYTYGPLLGLFSFGLLSKKTANDKLIPLLCVISPLLTYGIELSMKYIAPAYNMGFETLIINALIVYAVLFFTGRKNALLAV